MLIKGVFMESLIARWAIAGDFHFYFLFLET